MQLTKVLKKDKNWFARFEKDGEISEFEITEQEFNQGPTKEGYVFVDAFGGPGFDTASGTLEDGQYADMDSETYLVKLEGCVVKTVAKSAIADDVLSDSLAAAMGASGDNDTTLWQ
jgi:hypothetical protein